jgi:hypothetical protein
MLRGVNIMLGTGSGGTTQVLDEINNLRTNGMIDVVRVNFQAYWYDVNYTVPNLNMKYRDWITEVVQNDDANGVYTMLDKGEQYTEPPCVGNGDFCGDQNTGGQEANGTPEAGDPDYTGAIIDPNAWQEASDGVYMQPAYDDWAAIASQYGGVTQGTTFDPGVLYDTWNEAHKCIDQSPPCDWQSNQETMFNTIRQYSPNSLIFYYAPPDNNHKFYYSSYANLVEDVHKYPNSQNDFSCSAFDGDVGTAYSAGHAISIGEWGNPGGAKIEPYNTHINAGATYWHAGLIYYTLSYLFDAKGNINSNGQAFETDNKQDYANYSTTQNCTT